MSCEGKSRRQGVPCPGANTSLFFACGHEVERILPHSKKRTQKKDRISPRLDVVRNIDVLTCLLFYSGDQPVWRALLLLTVLSQLCSSPSLDCARRWIALDAGLR